MTVDPKTLRMMEICAELDALQDRGELTREKFLAAYRETEKLLGDGIESDGIEAITLYAQDPSWIPSD